MALVGRVFDASDPIDLAGKLREIVDQRPIGTVALAMSGDMLVALFDVANGPALVSGTNAGVIATGAPLSTTSTLGRELIIQADPSNASNVLVGGASRQDIVLVAGASLALDWVDVSTVWVKAVAPTMTVNWLVRG